MRPMSPPRKRNSCQPKEASSMREIEKKTKRAISWIDCEVAVISDCWNALWRLAYDEKAMIRVLWYLADRLGYRLEPKQGGQ